MSSYDYAKVWSNERGVSFHCTDSSELELIISQLKKYFSSLRIFNQRKLPSGDLYYCGIDRLSDRDNDAAWWIIKQLCLLGWEPLGAASSVSGSVASTILHYQFRRINKK